MRKIFINSGLLLATFLVVFIFLEVTIRIFAPIYAPTAAMKHSNENFNEYDSSYGWRNKKSFTTWVESQEYSTKIILNEKGLRGKEYPYEKQPGTMRIAVLGDSFAFGLGVDETDVISVKLEELFQKSGKKADVINMGVCGFGTDQEYLLLKQEGFKYEPDIVLCLFFIGNDIVNNSYGLQYHELKPYFILDKEGLSLKNFPVPLKKELSEDAKKNAEPRGRINIPFKYFFQRHSYAYTFIRLRYNHLLYKLGIRRSAESAISDAGLPVTEAIFLDMNRLCNDYNARLIVVVIPTKEQMSGIENDYLQRHFMKFADENGIHYIDLLKRLKGRKDLNFIIDSHWNKKGHAEIARLLYDELKAR